MKNTNIFATLLKEYQQQQKSEETSKLYVAYDYVDKWGEKDTKCCTEVCCDSCCAYSLCGC